MRILYRGLERNRVPFSGPHPGAILTQTHPPPGTPPRPAPRGGTAPPCPACPPAADTAPILQSGITKPAQTTPKPRIAPLQMSHNSYFTTFHPETGPNPTTKSNRRQFNASNLISLNLPNPRKCSQILPKSASRAWSLYPGFIYLSPLLYVYLPFSTF